MRKSLRAAFIAVTLSIILALSCISLPAFFAAERINIGSSSTITFTPPEAQKDALNNGKTGLKCEIVDGKMTLQATGVGSTSPEDLEVQHKALVDEGILRYAIYNGSLCPQSTKDNPELIIILDFSKYSINVFESGFLKALTYAVLGSNSKLGQGKVFEEDNQTGALTVYDSANGGAVITNKVVLTLQGVYKDGGGGIFQLQNSFLTKSDGTKVSIDQYSIRVILPGNQKMPVTLEAGSLTMTGIEVGKFSPKQPDCIGLGISHLGIDAKHPSSSIILEKGAATSPHFHWLTVEEGQMEYSLIESLDNLLGINGSSVAEGHIDEIFRKPQAYSDFSYLYMQAKKGTDTAEINIYDAPVGELAANSNGIAASLRLFYWFEHIYKLHEKNTGGIALTFNHYRRDKNNAIEETPGVLSYDRETVHNINGENCYAVYCSHFAENAGLIGYFSESGNLYDANKQPATV